MKSTLSLSLLCLAALCACTQANDLTVSTTIAGNSATHCPFTADRNQTLELTGVETIRFNVGRHNLRIDAAADDKGQLAGRGCASSLVLLDGLHITQVREGSTLVVGLEQTNDTDIVIGSGKGRYAWMELAVTLPTALSAELNIGSGDAVVRHLPTLSANVASGDLQASDIPGLVRVNVASGDAVLDRIGSLEATVASGDLKGSGIAGPVNLSALSSGDVTLSGVQGDLLIGNVGSGDLEADTVAGNVQIAAIGSGDVDLKHITGAVSVRAIGSGDLEVNGAAGLEVMQIGSGDVIHSNVSGRISLPRRN